LRAAGLVDVEMLGTSGYRTSEYTEAMYVRARKRSPWAAARPGARRGRGI